MADISQIEVNGTTYDICDATARDNYLPLTAGPDKVLTGCIYRTTDNTEVGATRDATLWNDLLTATDSEGDFNKADVHVRDIYTYAGTYGAQIEVTRTDTTAGTKHNGVAFYIDNDGNRDVNVSDATVWRNALGASSGIWPQSLGGTGASDLFKTLSATGAWGGNMAAGATKNVTVTFSVPSGYSIAAIRRVSAGRGGAAIAGFYISGSTVVVAISNPTSSSLSTTNVTVDVLCLPS